MEKEDNVKIFNIRKEGEGLISTSRPKARVILKLFLIDNNRLKKLFDEALDTIHYAGSCNRVGRCMRLGIFYKKAWAGGIVLGSTFPNIDDRDRFLGLKKYIKNFKERGLKSPWASENDPYWSRLQKIVNHARTFVFPDFQGKGIGTQAHKLLLQEGLKFWEAKYSDNVGALDTLCDHGDSKLFLANGWTLVGETKGFCSARNKPFSRNSKSKKFFKNNVGLIKNPKSQKWLVWVKVVDPSLFK
jgi:GNAT superfamily N-acetyltransferase